MVQNSNVSNKLGRCTRKIIFDKMLQFKFQILSQKYGFETNDIMNGTNISMAQI